MPKLTLVQFKKLLNDKSKPIYKLITSKKYPEAHKALTAYSEELDKQQPEDDTGKKAHTNHLKVRDYMKRLLDDAVAPVINQLKTHIKNDDLYQISLIIKEHQKALSGLPAYDTLTQDLGDTLKSSEGKKKIKTGKDFYKLYDNLVKKNSSANIKALEKFIKKHEGTSYAKAAQKMLGVLKDKGSLSAASSYF